MTLPCWRPLQTFASHLGWQEQMPPYPLPWAYGLLSRGITLGESIDPAPWGLTGGPENSNDEHRKDSPGKQAVGLQGSISSQEGSQRASVLCFLRRSHPPLLYPLTQDARGLTRWCWQSMSNSSVIDLAYIVFLFKKLKCSWLTILCYFQVYSEVIQRWG